MAINPAAGNPFGHLWGSFQSAVNDPVVRATPGGVQMYVWASVRADYLAKGDPLPAGSFQSVNAMLSLAGQQRAANLGLQSAINTYQRSGQDSALIRADHMAPDIDSRPPHLQPLGPDLRIRFEAGVMVEGEQIFMPLTYDPGLDWPQSISELLAGVEDAAQAAAQDYELEYAGVAAVTGITTV